MLLVDTKEKLFLDDKSLKEKIAGARPVTQWLRENVITMDDLYKHHDRERKISTGNIVEHVALYEGSEMEQDRCALQQQKHTSLKTHVPLFIDTRFCSDEWLCLVGLQKPCRS